MIRLLLLISISASAFASENLWDFSYGFQGRTYPAAGAITVSELGYNQLLWDKRTDEKKDMWKFGLLRPYLFAGSSVVVNQFEGGVDLYPVSLFSFGVGRRYDRSDFEFGFFDCDVSVECKNSYERNFVRAKLVLGFKGWVTFHVWRKESIIPKEKNRSFGEYTTVVLGDGRGDQLTTLQSFLGYQKEALLYGILFLHSHMERTNNYSNGFFAMHQRPIWGNWKLMMGIGPFQSSQQGNGAKVLFQLQRQIWKGVKLF